MEVILAQGDKKTGKTELCKKIVKLLTFYNFIAIEEEETNSFGDFLGIYEHKDCKTIIIINSGSDDNDIIKLFEGFYKKHTSKSVCDILISAIRPKSVNRNLNKYIKDIYKDDFEAEEYIVDLDAEKMKKEKEELDFCEFIDKILKERGTEILKKIKKELKCKIEFDCEPKYEK